MHLPNETFSQRHLAKKDPSKDAANRESAISILGFSSAVGSRGWLPVGGARYVYPRDIIPKVEPFESGWADTDTDTDAEALLQERLP